MLDRDQVKQKLRISLTDHCNWQCFFCHNEGQGPVGRTPAHAMTVEEIVAIARTAVSEGVTMIKLTGGEPLLYRSLDDDVTSLVRGLAALKSGVERLDLSMTTNASLMPEYADRLRDCGLDRVTVSITTLDSTTFDLLISPNSRLLARSIAGLRAARNAGLVPLKINMALYHSDGQNVGNLRELRDIFDVAAANDVSELRLFTLIWHPGLKQFDEYYQFFSPRMREELQGLLTYCGIIAPGQMVERLVTLAATFAHRVYPKVEFGVQIGSMRLGFEAMQFGRLPSEAGLQEGPYAMRVGSDGALRSVLNGEPSFELIDGVRCGMSDTELRRIYRAAWAELP
jgi:molybdenum cofactor biosynthesis enzyme MoaA